MVINYKTQKEKFNRFEKFWLNAWNDCFDKDNWLSVYQNNCRIYLDEYPEQEESRKEWFNKNYYFLYKNRFGKSSMILDGKGNEPEIETDNFFYSRFLKRK